MRGSPNAPPSSKRRRPAAAPRRSARLKQCRARRARGDRRGGCAGSADRGSGPDRPMATSRCARSRRSRRCSPTLRSSAPSRRRADDARDLHSAAGRAAGQPHAADAEIRGPADARAGRDSPGPRRGVRRRSIRRRARLSLLQRLANVGLGRRDEESEPPIAARASGPAMPPAAASASPPSARWQEQIAANEPVSEYARRPAPQGLDSHGRPAPVAPAPQGDDHLDIPAFLRRQAN